MSTVSMLIEWLRENVSLVGVFAVINIIATVSYFRNAKLISRSREAMLEERQQLAEELISERLKRKLAEQASKVASGEGSASFEGIRRAQEELDNREFELNAGKRIVLRTIKFEGLQLLGDGQWTLQPGVNVLLGRNGYGKTLVLRSLAGMLARYDEEVLLVRTGRIDPHSALEVARDDEVHPIQRLVTGFTSGSIGPAPVLAIPDTRFFNRAERAVRLPPDPFRDLRRHGARHFLEQLPYNGVVQSFLYGLCLDYIDRNRSFDLPLFRLLTEVFAGLTGEAFRFESVERLDNVSFQMMVRTEGNDESIPIQLASQGTLSVLAMFGLIFQFLKELAGDEDKAQQQSGIVIIDEIDAHLHPKWQQRIVALLRRHFPNVQFILSAHSPLLVAGCRYGEVAVMRKAPYGFVVETALRDFVGAATEEIYRVVFEIEDGLDHTYLALAESTDHGRSPGSRGTNLDVAHPLETERLLEETVLRERVTRREQERSRTLEHEIERESQEVEVHSLRKQLDAAQAELEQTRAELANALPDSAQRASI